GNITISNAGTFNVSGNNAFHFVSPLGTSNFDNSGQFNLTGSAGFFGLSDFNSSGVVNLANGDPVEVLTITGNFNGQDGARLAIDAQLTPGGKADLLIIGGKFVDDELVLTGGNLTGTIQLDITDLAGGTGGFISDADGTLFALVGGGTGTTNFSTVGGAGSGLFRHEAYLREQSLE